MNTKVKIQSFKFQEKLLLTSWRPIIQLVILIFNLPDYDMEMKDSLRYENKIHMQSLTYCDLPHGFSTLVYWENGKHSTKIKFWIPNFYIFVRSYM